MGFGEITYNSMVNSLSNAQMDRLANPYYKWIQQKPQIVTYWNINNKRTTLDPGMTDSYDQLGNKSSFRYNRIKNFILYGISRTRVEMELQDYGVESAEIGGECLVLPNTIIPQPNDYFQLDILGNQPYLFRIVQVTVDNLETPGNNRETNFYKCRYLLDNSRQDWLESLNGRQLVKKFVFKMENVGSNTTSIITEEEDTALTQLQSIYETLRKYYVELFWRPNIQTFVCGYLDGQFFYDGYLIEFIMRNGLFSSSNELEYLYIDQAVHTPSTFLLEYDRTIFADIENRKSQLHTNSAYLVPVHDPNSLLVDRMEDYHQLSVNLSHKGYSNPINNIHNNLFANIQENTPFNEDDTANHVLYWNIIVNFLNQDKSTFSFTEAEINSLTNIKFRYCKDLFYEIPILLYIIKTYISDLQEKGNTEIAEEYEANMEHCFNVKK